MRSITLIIPASGTELPGDSEINAYHGVLAELADGGTVELVIAGETTSPLPADVIHVSGLNRGTISSVRAALEAASGELVVVVDARRSYPAAAIKEAVTGLLASDADLMIAVPRRQHGRSWPGALARRGLGVLSKVVLGTSDTFSGLLVMWRDRVSEPSSLRHASGSWLVLDALTWPGTVHRDVAVEAGPTGGARLLPIELDDFKQLKRVLDHRFGMMSRLVQFCMVGASGMVVDLSLYALLQWLFARLWSTASGTPAIGLSWQLATAAALSIFTAMVWNFTLNRRLTFNDSRGGSILRQFLTYALGNALAIAVNLSLRLYLPHSVGFFARHRLAAAVVGIVVATGISFSMSRWIVFIRRPAAAVPLGRAALPAGPVLHESAVLS